MLLVAFAALPAVPASPTYEHTSSGTLADHGYLRRTRVVTGATVELQDGIGFGSATNQKVTDQDGRVEFNTVTGMHRIRISGADFYPLESELEITPVEECTRRDFRVKRKTDDVVTTWTTRVPSLPYASRSQTKRGRNLKKEVKRSRSRTGRPAANISRPLSISTRTTT